MPKPLPNASLNRAEILYRLKMMSRKSESWPGPDWGLMSTVCPQTAFRFGLLTFPTLLLSRSLCDLCSVLCAVWEAKVIMWWNIIEFGSLKLLYVSPALWPNQTDTVESHNSHVCPHSMLRVLVNVSDIGVSNVPHKKLPFARWTVWIPLLSLSRL